MSTARRDYVVPLLAAVIGLAGGLLGAHFGSEATITTQREQAREDRRVEARAKRAKVYSEFLDAAGSYASESRAVIAEFQRRKKRSGCRRCNVPGTIVKDYLPAKSKFQGALNQVYIYGTQRGVRAARKVAGALPPSLYKPREISIGGVEEPAYARAYSGVLDIMCAEVSADPRPTC